MFKLYKIIDWKRKEIKQTTKTDLSYKLNKKPIKLWNSLLKNKDYNKIF